MLSVVTSVYRTAQFLDAFAQRVDSAVRQCGIADVEMIFVIDGSPDDAIAKLRDLKVRYPVIRIVELSRNFGHHSALWCGLEHATGDMIFLADSDLETPPEIFRDLHAALMDPQMDVAFTSRPEREDPVLRRWASMLFWKLFGLLADVEIPRNILTECLMRRRVSGCVVDDGRSKPVSGWNDAVGGIPKGGDPRFPHTTGGAVVVFIW